jgi:outer membrane protein, multidrug efflux system
MNVKFSALALAGLLAACGSAVKMPDSAQVQSDAQIRAAAAWQAVAPNLPHSGSQAQLVDWWRQLGDGAFDDIMKASQDRSPTLAQALSRVAQARAGAARAGNALSPNLNLNAQAGRSVQAPKAPPATFSSASLQASWELDLWGGNRSAQSAAEQRVRGAELGWHEARVAVAAETASAYIGYRYCENLASLLERDAASRAETSRLAELTAKAGFSAPATAQLARASSFDAASSVAAARAQCEVQIKALVALSGIGEPELREKLKKNASVAGDIAAQSTLFSVANMMTQLPAQLLTQRPDIASAQLDITAAALDIRAADARRYPSLTLNGSVGAGRTLQMGMASSGLTWGIGPIALNLPFTNQQVTRSNTEAAIAAYDAAVIALQAKARLAVSEVEAALVNLDAATVRGTLAKNAVEGYAASLAATQSRYRAGLASLVELEDARRTAVFAEQSQLNVERDRVAAWISLYRATGGGWTQGSPISATSRAPS